jgi:hypothetical protein
MGSGGELEGVIAKHEEAGEYNGSYVYEDDNAAQ